jgi:hypothetical protein
LICVFKVNQNFPKTTLFEKSARLADYLRSISADQSRSQVEPPGVGMVIALDLARFDQVQHTPSQASGSRLPGVFCSTLMNTSRGSKP